MIDPVRQSIELCGSWGNRLTLESILLGERGEGLWLGGEKKTKVLNIDQRRKGVRMGLEQIVSDEVPKESTKIVQQGAKKVIELL